MGYVAIIKISKSRKILKFLTIILQLTKCQSRYWLQLEGPNRLKPGSQQAWKPGFFVETFSEHCDCPYFSLHQQDFRPRERLTATGQCRGGGGGVARWGDKGRATKILGPTCKCQLSIKTRKICVSPYSYGYKITHMNINEAAVWPGFIVFIVRKVPEHGHLGFSVLRCSTKSSFQAILIIQIIYLWTRPIKITYPESSSPKRKCKNSIFHFITKSKNNRKCPALHEASHTHQSSSD